MFLNDLQNRLYPQAIPTLLLNGEDSQVVDKCTTETPCSAEVLALPLPVSPEMPSSIEKPLSPGLSASFSGVITLNSPLVVSSPSPSICCKILRVWSEKTPRKVLLRARLQQEKEARFKAEKAVLTLTNQLTEYGTVKNFLTICENYLSPDVLTIVKSHLMSKTRNPHGYRYKIRNLQYQNIFSYNY